MLLQTGQLLSHFGSQTTTIAYPLLVLAVTHSPAKAGLVACARYLGTAVVGLPAGLAADRGDRKRLMIGADPVRLAGLGALVAPILLDRLSVWPVSPFAFVEG